MISRYIEYNVICDTCGRDGSNEYNDYDPNMKWVPHSTKGARDAKENAKKVGWLITRCGAYCPKCAAVLKKEA